MPSPLIHERSNPRDVRDRLGDIDVHLWSARIDLPAERVLQLERCLTREERRRGPHRRLSRAVLRHVLAGYVCVSPADLPLSGDVDRKPYLESSSADGLHFNVSHSGDILLLVIGRTPYLGVDLERIRPVRRFDTIARRAFSDGERAAIEALPAELRQTAFYNCWTRKEACVKALGDGVWSAFGRWEVSVEPGEPPRVLVADGDPTAGPDWSLHHLEPAPGYVGALAVRGREWNVEAWALDAVKEMP